MSTPIVNFDFMAIPGVGPAISRALANMFVSWEDVLDADEAVLKDIRGIRDETIRALRSQAQAAIMSERDLAQRKQTVNHVVDAPSAKGDEKRYLRRSVRIDRFNTLTKLVEITPAVCLDCGFDVIERNGLNHWDNLSPVTRERVQVALGDHRVAAGCGTRILTESELRAAKSADLIGFNDDLPLGPNETRKI